MSIPNKPKIQEEAFEEPSDCESVESFKDKAEISMVNAKFNDQYWQEISKSSLSTYISRNLNFSLLVIKL